MLRRTSRRRDRVGRPAVFATLTRLLPTGLRRGYGYMRIQGELRCLAHRMATTAIRKIDTPEPDHARRRRHQARTALPATRLREHIKVPLQYISAVAALSINGNPKNPGSVRTEQVNLRQSARTQIARRSRLVSGVLQLLEPRTIGLLVTLRAHVGAFFIAVRCPGGGWAFCRAGGDVGLCAPEPAVAACSGGC